MNIIDIQQKILTDDLFVLEETRKIQYLYGLKTEIRYAYERHEDVHTESVAEHVYAMHVLASYFLPLEDSDKKLDWQKVYEMITFHDIDEVETGDMIGYLKTDAIRASEAAAAMRVIKRSPEVIKQHIQAVLEEYEALTTSEALFVKAIDRCEPIFHLFNEEGKKIFERNKTTREQSEGLKRPYVQNLPYLKRFFEVTGEAMEKDGYYAT